MKISPITKNHSYRAMSKNRNVSFGRFQDDTAKVCTYTASMGCFLNPTQRQREKGYDRTRRNMTMQLINYLSNSPFVNINTAQDTSGKTFVYAQLNTQETNKHKNKNYFDKVVDYFKLDFDTSRTNKPAKETGIANSEGFLTVIESFPGLCELCEEISDAEEGNTAEPPAETYDDEFTFQDRIDNGWYAF